MARLGNSNTIENLIQAIERLPSDLPVHDPRKWYTTQKEHWLGWLKEYHDTGAYNRQATRKRDAKFAYNHIVEPKMLLWLIEAAGIDSHVVSAAKRATMESATMQSKSATIRQLVPWETLEKCLWEIASK